MTSPSVHTSTQRQQMFGRYRCFHLLHCSGEYTIVSINVSYVRLCSHCSTLSQSGVCCQVLYQLLDHIFPGDTTSCRLGDCVFRFYVLPTNISRSNYLVYKNRHTPQNTMEDTNIFHLYRCIVNYIELNYLLRNNLDYFIVSGRKYFYQGFCCAETKSRITPQTLSLK